MLPSRAMRFSKLTLGLGLWLGAALACGGSPTGGAGAGSGMQASTGTSGAPSGMPSTTGSTGTSSGLAMAGSSGATGSTDGGRCPHNVLNHRPTIGTCPPTALGPDAATASCVSAADCADSGLRYCLGGSCALDECTSDTNCGATGMCSCGFIAAGNAAGEVFPNTCVQGEDCQTDANCASGYCSPSLDGIFIGGSRGGTNYSYSYHCHVCADTCTNDSDCGPQTNPTMPGTSVCMYTPQLGHFACGTPSVGAG